MRMPTHPYVEQVPKNFDAQLLQILILFSNPTFQFNDIKIKAYLLKLSMST